MPFEKKEDDSCGKYFKDSGKREKCIPAFRQGSRQLTKECLQLALVDLMAEKPFEKITVTELVLKSGVSRQSFYRNYESKEDILKICIREWKML